MNDELIDSYLSYLRDVLGYSTKTIVSYAHDLRRLSEYSMRNKLDFQNFTFDEARNFVSELYAQQLSPSTISRIVSGQKGFFRYLCENSYLSSSPFAHVSGAKTVRNIPNVLTKEELKAILDFPYSGYTQLMEITMFSLFYSTGCRLSELMGMKVADIQAQKGRALVTGKGSKQRFVFLSPRALRMLNEYLPERNRVVQNTVREDPGYLIINEKGKCLPISTVHSIFDKYGRKLGLTKKFTPHVFRHTFATDLLDNDSDIRLVQELLGHESIGTTQIYTHVSTKRLTEVYRKTHPHGQKVQKES